MLVLRRETYVLIEGLANTVARDWRVYNEG